MPIKNTGVQSGVQTRYSTKELKLKNQLIHLELHNSSSNNSDTTQNITDPDINLINHRHHHHL